MSINTIEKMRQKLAALSPQKIDIIDDSHKHAGHEGAKSGGGHYRLTLVSAAFAACSTLARQRMVYAALGEMMRRDIHAISMKVYTPQEFSEQ